MTKKDFFTVLIKVFALFSLVSSVFTVLPLGVSYIVSGMDTKAILWFVAILMATIGLFIFFLLKAERVVKFLKLDKGFDTDLIELGNFKPADLIKIGTFIIGGLLIINSLPQFLSYVFFAFKYSVANANHGGEKFNMATSGAKVVLGYLLLVNYQLVAKWFSSEKEQE